MFSCEFCKISKNTSSHRTSLVAASVYDVVLFEKIVNCSWRCSVEKMILEIPQNSQENTCTRASFLIKLEAQGYNFIKKEALEQMFSSGFCEISKNTFFTEHLRWLLQCLRSSKQDCQFFEKENLFRIQSDLRDLSQLLFTCSESPIETLEKGVKYVQI